MPAVSVCHGLIANRIAVQISFVNLYMSVTNDSIERSRVMILVIETITDPPCIQ